jgi:hypothetical protein
VGRLVPPARLASTIAKAASNTRAIDVEHSPTLCFRPRIELVCAVRMHSSQKVFLCPHAKVQMATSCVEAVSMRFTLS